MPSWIDGSAAADVVVGSEDREDVHRFRPISTVRRRW